jgi:hypothetical protein
MNKDLAVVEKGMSTTFLYDRKTNVDVRVSGYISLSHIY